MKTIIVLLLVLALAAPPAFAQSVDPGLESLDDLLSFLRQLWQQIDQVFEWVWQLTDYADTARESLAPILDRAYSAQVLARRIESLIAGLPERVQSTLTALANRLRTVPAPQPAKPRWVLEQVISADPNSDTAQQARKLDQVAEQNATALASVRSAAEVARAAAQQVARDMSPQSDAMAAVAAARELALRAQDTPSTRAAMQLLVEAMAAQIDQQSRMAMHQVGRQSALIQQQTLLSQQFATMVDRLAAMIDQQNAQQKEQLARQTAAAANVVESQRQTYREIAQSLLELNSQQHQQAMDQFFTMLTGRR